MTKGQFILEFQQIIEDAYDPAIDEFTVSMSSWELVYRAATEGLPWATIYEIVVGMRRDPDKVRA
jgi:hypothetical protein